jgi:hypothetical protein
MNKKDKNKENKDKNKKKLKSKNIKEENNKNIDTLLKEVTELNLELILEE